MKASPTITATSDTPVTSTFATAYPALAAEWDLASNRGLRPDQIPPESQIAVHWLCPKCGHSYIAKISDRIAEAKAKSEANATSGANAEPRSSLCPYCSKREIYNRKSLAAASPVLADDWDGEFNGDATPFNTLIDSTYPVMWHCRVCGCQWRATINDRLKMHTGCPDCAAYASQTSLPQLVILHYIKELFPDAANRFALNPGASAKTRYEIDVYVPSIKLGIEYDGEFFHSKPEQFRSDLRKNAALKKAGIELVRFREPKCPTMSDPDIRIITAVFQKNYPEFSTILQTFLDELRTRHGISKKVEVDIESIEAEANENLYKVPYERSLAAALARRPAPSDPHDTSQALWDYERNWPLMPEDFTAQSTRRVQWICHAIPPHHWESIIENITNLGRRCARCVHRHHYTTDEWIALARKVHGNKYDYSKVEYLNNKVKVSIICPIHGEFTERPSHHLDGHGCSRCATIASAAKRKGVVQRHHPKNQMNDKE